MYTSSAMDFKIVTLFSVLVAAQVLQQSLVLARTRPKYKAPVEVSSKDCFNRKGEIGECVQNYLCDRNTGTIIEDGSDIIDARSQSSSCIAPLVCCKAANGSTAQHHSNVHIPMSMRQQRAAAKPGCGWRNENGLATVQNTIPDDFAKPGEFPWMVSIMRKEAHKSKGQNEFNYVGCGFLINEKAVLTAAHVVARENTPDMLYVVVGNYDGTRLLPKVLKRVNSIVLHEQYSAGNNVNDIALITIRKKVEWMPNMGYICLPPANAAVTPGSRCFASGWGTNADNDHQYVLGKADLPVMSHDACQTSMRTTDLGRFFVLNQIFMCAGGEVGKDTCKGDAGSPLACPIEGQPGRYMASGVLSWGMSCGLDGLPSVYIDVARARQWIDEKMVENGLSTDSYSVY